MFQLQFERLGLSKPQSQIYLVLAELGRASASTLAKRCKIPRSTAYSLLSELVNRGLVSEQPLDGVTVFVANQPSALVRMVEQQRVEQEREFRSQAKIATELADSISGFFKNETHSVPRLQFFEGRRGVEAILYEYAPLWQKSIAQYDHTWWGYQDDEFVTKYRPWFDEYWAGMYKEERVYLFSNKTPREKQLEGKVARRIIKPLPKNTTSPVRDITSTIWILGDYVVNIMTRTEPHYAFQLRDPLFAANQRQIFQIMWGM